MADEFIKRSDAIDAITERMYEYMNKAYSQCPGGYREEEMYSNAALGCRAASEEIKAIPSADVQPVVHGKNIGKDYDEVDQFVCSCCGIELQGWYRVERDEDDGEETYHEHRFNFCPNCGADMRSNAK